MNPIQPLKDAVAGAESEQIWLAAFKIEFENNGDGARAGDPGQGAQPRWPTSASG